MDLSNLPIWGIIVGTTITSIKGFENNFFFNRYKFNIGAIVQKKQYERMFTSGFLHADAMHLFFNMLALYFFGPKVIGYTSNNLFLLIYFFSMLGGSILSFYIEKNRPAYSAIGASGAVSGVIYASIAIDPHLKMIVFPLPIALPGWIFAIAYMYYSIFGMRNAWGNLGHSAHLGGAISGLLITLGIFPELFYINKLYIMLMLIPIIYWLFFEVKRR